MYTRSSLKEQTTPVALTLSDTFAIVSNVSFVDYDLDLGEIGGPITWDGSDVAEVTGYAVYLARAAPAFGEARFCAYAWESLRATGAVIENAEILGSDSMAGEWASGASVISGSFQLTALGNAVALRMATRASVAHLLSIDSTNVSASVNGARRLSRQLSSETSMSFQAVVPSMSLTASLDLLLAVSAEPVPFAAMMAHFLFALGVDRAISTEVMISGMQVFEVPMSQWMPEEGNESVSGLSAENLGVSLPTQLLAVCERIQVANVSVGIEQLDLPPEFDLQNWTHILVYSVANGAEQSTPAASRIEDVSSSISALRFVDKDLDEGDLGGQVQWAAPNDLRRLEAYRVYLTKNMEHSLVGAEIPVGTNERSIPADTISWPVLEVFTKSQLAEQSTPVSLAISDTSSSVSAIDFVDDDLDLTDLGGQVSWVAPADRAQVSQYVVYLAEACQDSVVAEVTGSISLSLPGATQEQVIAAVKTSLAASLGVSEATIVLTSITAGRRLSTTWDITYSLSVPVAQASQLVSQTSAISADASAFLSTLRQELLVQGVDSVSVNSMVLLSFPTATVRVVIVDSSNTTDDSDPLPDGNTSDGVRRLDRRLSTSPGAVPLWICTANLLDNATVNETVLDIPADTALRLAFQDLDLDLGEFGGLLSWSPASDEDLVEDYLVYFGAPAVLINGHWMCASMEDGTNDTSDVNGTGWCPTLYFGRVPVGTDAQLASERLLKDLDMHDLGGVLSWEPPETLRWVTSYYVYLAEDAAGSARSQIQPMLMAGDNDIDVPAETPRLNFTHFVVYTASILAEQTTPSFRAIQDEASRAANVSFIDEDLDEFEVGGPLTWLEPEDFSEVTAYNVYLAESRDGENRSLLGNVSVGTNRFDVPADTQLASFTHLVVFAESSLVEQTTPAAVRIIETVASVSALNFVDQDLDPAELGGFLSWRAASSPLVQSYNVYLASDAVGTGRLPAAGGIISVTQTHAILPADTAINNFTHFLVFTESVLAEQSTPVATPLSDSFGLARNIDFYDLDLDDGDLGGNLSWQPPVDDSLVIGYNVFLADAAPCQDCGRSAVANLSETLVQIPADTPVLNWTDFLIYARSSFAEQSTPATYAVVDANASVSGINFVDKDLEYKEIGGTLLWTAPDSERVESYGIYLSDASQNSRITLGYVGQASTTRLIPAETETYGLEFLSIYTRSILAEQSTPVALEISDTGAVITNVSFVDYDLDESDLGGNLSWTEPDDLSQVEQYNIYFATTRCDSSDGFANSSEESDSRLEVSFCDRTFFGTTPLGDSDIAVLPETSLGNFTHFLVYANSSLAEQSIPAWHEIFDMNASVSGIHFVDLDLDETQLGGNISWTAPADPSRVQDYVVSLSNDALQRSGTAETSDLGVVASEELVLPPEAPIADFILVYTRSQLVEQTTPVAFDIVDAVASVSNITFPDHDLDETDIGGTLSWLPPTTVGSEEVTIYMVYLATMSGVSCGSHDWCVRSYFAQAPAEMDNISVPPETPLENFTHWLVFTRSRLVEQSTPVAHEIFDAVSSVSGIQFTDKDLDILELGGTVTWLEPVYSMRISNYNLYLSMDPAGLGRNALGSAVQQQLLIGPDVPSEGYSFISVYTESTLVEQTTPVSLQFFDRESLVQNVSFPDFDLDYDDLGGTLEWGTPQDDTQVTHYVVYMVVVPADDFMVNDCEAMITEDSIFEWSPPGFSLIGAYQSNVSTICNRSFYAVVPVGTQMIQVPQNLSLHPYTHWAVYTKSTLVEQSTPSSLLIYDYVANVSNITFQGLDLDYAHLGGTIEWVEPALTQRVYSYVVYLAETAMGEYRSQVENEVLVGGHQLLVPPDTLRLSYTHFVIYTKSTLAEQTTPSYLAFLDEISVAGNVTFVDDDLDRHEIGGDLVWLQPEDDSEVTHYIVYLAEDRSGSNRSLLGNVSQGVHLFAVPPDTPLMAFTHLCIFARSVLVEATTPSSVLVVDISSSISALSFTDLDLDPLELGGWITWTPPGNFARVVSYMVYLATDPFGAGRVQVGEVPLGGSSQLLLPETTLDAFSHVVVYSKSILAEQSTPVAFSIVDNVAQVSDIVFPDFDLDADDLGGILEWQAPSDTSKVSQYEVYMLEVSVDSPNCSFRNSTFSMDSTCERRHFGSSPVGVENLTVPVDTAVENYSYFAIFSRSSLVEQTTPTMHLFDDMIASVSNIRFTDQDLDDEEIGGRILWTHPSLMQRVYTYRLYLSSTDYGLQRSLIAELPKTMSAEDLPPETEAAPFLAIYTTSTLTEQTTPVALAVEDKFAPVSNISFPDFDLDETDLGGTLTWAPPLDESQVEQYMIYLAMFTQNASECPDTADSTSFVALVTGSMTLTLAGASPSQLESAMKASLAAFLSVPISWISVSVNPAARRLNRRDRRLSTSWTVQYQVVVPAGSEASVVASANSLGSSNSFEASLAAELVAEGISSSDVAGLTVVSFSTVSVSFVFPESVTPLFSANQTENATSIFEVITTSSTRTTTTSITTTRRSNASEDSHDVTRQMRCPLFLVAFATRSNARSY
ncbi:unnamed protein product [Durusdinium trenchii]|uniref:Uncharacterized protein n=1 Tax=Durusdinium trenchii TaxID=1381693 RepID=A0ABP0SQT0_9DINO